MSDRDEIRGEHADAADAADADEPFAGPPGPMSGAGQWSGTEDGSVPGRYAPPAAQTALVGATPQDGSELGAAGGARGDHAPSERRTAATEDDPDAESGTTARHKPGAPAHAPEAPAAHGEAPARPAEAPLEAAPGIGFVPHITVTALIGSADSRRAVERAADDRRMVRAAIEIVEGGLETAPAYFSEHPVPDLILAETQAGDGEAILRGLEALAEHCPPGTRLVLIGRTNDVQLYRTLLRGGVGDYLVAPVRPLALIEAVAQLFGEAEGARPGSVTAFIGARGGAGSSTVAVNSAAAMAAHSGAAVLLLDLDLHAGTAALDLDLEPAQGVLDALAEGERLDEILLDRLVTKRDGRIGLLASPASLDAAEPDEESIGHLIQIARKVAPHLLIDLPQHWTPWLRAVLLAADEIVLTAAPDLGSLRNARNVADMLRKPRANDPSLRLVLNQLGQPKRREVGEENFARVLDIEPAVRIPWDAAAFSAAATTGKPVAESRGNTAAAAAFEALARTLSGRQKAVAPKPKGLGALARRLLGAS